MSPALLRTASEIKIPRSTRGHPWRVGLVGAGYIAETHAAVLAETPDVLVTTVVDLQSERAAGLAQRWQVPRVLSHVEALADSRDIDVAHILLPPQLHASAASQLLSAGIHALIEKPMGQSPEECDAITAAARVGRSQFAVNHNFIYHPAHTRARAWAGSGRLGQLRHVTMDFNMPLQQLTARQFGHWMFDSVRNLLLEQAIHPLSLLDNLMGPVIAAEGLASPPENIGGHELTRSFMIQLRSEHATAQLRFSVGETYPLWKARLICDDGAIAVDYLANRVQSEETRRSLPVFNFLHNGLSGAGSTVVQDARNTCNYVLSTLGLQGRTDPFFVSMKESIRAFYRGLGSETAVIDGGQSKRLVELCSELAGRAGAPLTVPKSFQPTKSGRSAKSDVAVIGGTGFIGQHVVRALRAQGKTVVVMARSVRRLPPVFEGRDVVMKQGDATRYEDVREAISGAEVVVNLAHGGGSDPDEIIGNLVGGARAVAEACLDAGTKRLIFVSSIAALYLGNPRSVVTGMTPPDLQASRRDAYSRAKIEAERLLLELHAEQSLPVCILRPGVVLGEGGTPFHSGFGFFNNERHCMGWNWGKNPLPLVLASDVAEAIVRSLEAPNVTGHCYNLVGDVRLTAREYIPELARVLGRPLCFHPQSVYRLFAVELLKFLIKRFSGRREAVPSLRDLRSRGLLARFDCSDAIRDLGWQPVADREEFIRTGIEVHGRP
jgi:predicted dehydrogenase